jgi:hypothetical protein
MQDFDVQTVELFRSHPSFLAPDDTVASIRKLLGIDDVDAGLE